MVPLRKSSRAVYARTSASQLRVTTSSSALAASLPCQPGRDTKQRAGESTLHQGYVLVCRQACIQHILSLRGSRGAPLGSGSRSG